MTSPVSYFALLAAQLFSMWDVSEATEFYSWFPKGTGAWESLHGLKRLFTDPQVAEMQPLLTIWMN